MKYYIIAGEASGDLHASNLMKELKLLDDHTDFRAWGGDLMQAQGAVLVKHYRDLAFMGFTEVLMNLRTIFRNIDICKKDLLEHRPDVLILVDYPGFNLRIAKWAKQQGLKIIYYISPQVWAWKENRVCLLYTSDAADERSSVDLGGRRIIKKKKQRSKRMSNKEIHKKKINKKNKTQER